MNRYIHLIKSLTLLLYYFFLSPACIYCMGLFVSPIEQTIQIGTRGEYTIINQKENPLAIELFAEETSLNAMGEEKRIPTNDLAIYPSQFFLQSGKQKLVKICYQGEEKLECEKLYRIVIREIPINFTPQEKSHIHIATAYHSLFFVQPKKSFSKISIQSAEIEGNQLILRIYNEGNVHVQLEDAVLELKKEGKTIKKLLEEEISSLDRRYLLAQSERQFILNLAEETALTIAEIDSIALQFTDQEKKKQIASTLNRDKKQIVIHQEDAPKANG